MRWFKKISQETKLYSFAAPLALVPLMDFSFSEVGDYLRGMEFRAFLAELLTQVTTGVVDAAIVAIVGIAFGAF